MKVKVLVTQSCLTLRPQGLWPRGSSVHGILQARRLEWAAFPSPGDLPNPGIKPGLLHCRQILYHLSHQSTMLCYVLCLVAQSCPTHCDPMDYIARQAPLSMGILQARILQWVAMPFSRGSSQPRDQSQVSCIAGGFVTV